MIAVIIVIAVSISLSVYNKYTVHQDYMIDTSNLDELNLCAAKEDVCDAWKCLGETMVSENDYYQRYETYCMDKVCDSFVKTINDVTFINADNTTCLFLYKNVVLVRDIDIDDISDETLTCLSVYRGNMNVSDEEVYVYAYHDGHFYDFGDMIDC